MREGWDAMRHLWRDARGSVRHLLALVLAAGTTAGTVFTFSGGRLSLAGVGELVVSVGGVALALELGVLYCAVYLGNLAELAHTARRADRRAELEAQYHNLFRWFLVVLAVSVVANIIFRAQQLGNIWLALFVGVAPGPLILLFAVKLRKLPVDYAELARQRAQEAMTEVVAQSGRILVLGMRRIAEGAELDERESRRLRLAGAFLLPHAQPDERQGLGDAMDMGLGAGGGAPIVEGSAVEWLSSADVADRYDIPRRTAQQWIKGLPGSAQKTRGRERLADASRLYAQHGVPQPALRLVPDRGGRAHLREPDAIPAQSDASEPLALDAPRANEPLASAGLV